MKRVQNAFSLVELLTAVGIVIVIGGLCFPAYAKARQEGKRTVKIAQLRQLSIALLEYTESNNGGLPPLAYGTGAEWHNIILPGPVNKTALALANPDKADKSTNIKFSYHIGYSINQCLMRHEISGHLAEEYNPYLLFQATELKTRNSKSFHKTWHLGCHDKQYAKLHDLVAADGRLLADIDNGGSLAVKVDGSIKWDSYKLFENQPCTCAFSGQKPETPFQTFFLRS